MQSGTISPAAFGVRARLRGHHAPWHRLKARLDIGLPGCNL